MVSCLKQGNKLNQWSCLTCKQGQGLKASGAHPYQASQSAPRGTLYFQTTVLIERQK